MNTITQPGLPFAVQKKRDSKRARLEQLFLAYMGRQFSSKHLHGLYGSSVRTRISELNRDPNCPIKIKNRTVSGTDGSEVSFYWSEKR